MNSRRFALTTTAVVVALATSAPAYAQVRQFDIPAQPAVKGIPELARQARIQIVAAARDLEGVRTPVIKGRMDVRAALRRMIANTPLEIASDDGQVVTLRSRRAVQGAQTREVAGKGELTGQVIDPATREYLRAAIVEVTAANGDRRSITTGEGGEYRLADVPAGPATITVRYIGYASQNATVSVSAGGTTRQDFAMTRGDERGELNDEIVVIGVREGDARAIMSQRQSMDIKNSLSAESYGDIADGNPGEFIKFMPGVDTDAGGDGDGTVRNVKLRGLPAEYTAVTLNGVSLAGVDAMTGAAGSRTFSFEQLSLSSIDSIEISKTISADVDANAPAGTINIKTKRAFDRKGRRILLQASASTHANLWDSREHTGPGEGGYGGKRFLPNWQVEYSDVLLGGRLGVVASVSKSNLYIEHEQVTLGRSNVPTAISPEPLAITSIETQQDSREISRLAASLNMDFKASDELVLSLASVYNEADIWAASTAYKFTTNARTRGVIGDPLFDITTQQAATAASMSIQNTLNYKTSKGKTIIPSFNYETGQLAIDGNLFYSDSISTYDPQGEKDSAYVLSALTARGNFSAQREPGDLFGQKWQIQQLSGGDWSDPASFSGPSALILRLNNGPYAKRTQRGGALNATYRTDVGGLPLVLKVGFKNQRAKWLYRDETDKDRYRYVGDLSTADLFAQIQGGNQVSFADSGIDIRTLNGSSYLYMPSGYKLLELYRQHPEYWTATAATTASEWYSINVGNNRQFAEETNALYAMGTAELTEKLKVRAGLRWEQTTTTALEVDALSAQEVAAAGYPVSASTGMATTIPGLEYQYFSRPKVERKGTYDYFFPSASLKYSFTPSTDLQLGYSRTIRRPEVGTLTGIWSIDDINQVIRAPNPGLKPEISDNISLRLAQYFEPVGVVAINLYQNKVKGLFQTQDLTADEFGYTGTEYSDYTFRTTTTVGGEAISIRGWEFEFSHAMKYLPSPLDGLSVRGSLSMNYPEVPIVGVADKMGSISLSYRKGPVKLYLNTAWTGDKYRSTTPSYYDDFWDMSFSGSVAVHKGVEAFFSIRNLLNSARNVIVEGSTVTSSATPYDDYSAVYLKAGTSGVIGLRARF
ncbi:MAG: TonB-dependent receptor [Sphingopyxis sp.]|uniref:TonB-dependent receptor domain-containing protein n=1 Tax=Sphingopyxis sp. TaxID=1908224 RepID=UPI001A22D680|nr:TonB-dependent receptor [Sphingopyxis sp.]MBJ7498655.1 TonB-dependent receptor [Sphingopyxis sp.]